MIISIICLVTEILMFCINRRPQVFLSDWHYLLSTVIVISSIVAFINLFYCIKRIYKTGGMNCGKAVAGVVMSTIAVTLTIAAVLDAFYEFFSYAFTPFAV